MKITFNEGNTEVWPVLIALVRVFPRLLRLPIITNPGPRRLGAVPGLTVSTLGLEAPYTTLTTTTILNNRSTYLFRASISPSLYKHAFPTPSAPRAARSASPDGNDT